MDKRIISVVLPSYNMEKYLSRCVESLIVNDFLGKYEIIIVNDGSKDNTLEIANRYKEKYNDTINVVDKKNGHYGSAVNAGLQVAKGKYFKVLDADDWFDNKGFEELLIKLDNDVTADVVFTHWAINNTEDNSITNSARHSNPYDKVLDIDSVITDNNKYSFYSFYGIAYRTDLLREINYHQTEGVCYTDVEYGYYPIMNARTALFLDIDLYQYFIGREGQTITEEAMGRNVMHMYKVSRRMAETFRNTDSEVKKHFQYCQFKLINTNLYFSCLCLNKKNVLEGMDLKFIDNCLKKNLPEVYKSLEEGSCLKVPYVKLWRQTGLSCHSLYKIRKLL